MRTASAIIALLLGTIVYAQDLQSGPYILPYKNTYVRNVFVAENTFRTDKQPNIEPQSFKKAKKILPAPYWEGHDQEIQIGKSL